MNENRCLCQMYATVLRSIGLAALYASLIISLGFPKQLMAAKWTVISDTAPSAIVQMANRFLPVEPVIAFLAAHSTLGDMLTEVDELRARQTVASASRILGMSVTEPLTSMLEGRKPVAWLRTGRWLAIVISDGTSFRRDVDGAPIISGSLLLLENGTIVPLTADNWRDTNLLQERWIWWLRTPRDFDGDEVLDLDFSIFTLGAHCCYHAGAILLGRAPHLYLIGEQEVDRRIRFVFHPHSNEPMVGFVATSGHLSRVEGIDTWARFEDGRAVPALSEMSWSLPDFGVPISDRMSLVDYFVGRAARRRSYSESLGELVVRIGRAGHHALVRAVLAQNDLNLSAERREEIASRASIVPRGMEEGIRLPPDENDNRELLNALQGSPDGIEVFARQFFKPSDSVTGTDWLVGWLPGAEQEEKLFWLAGCAPRGRASGLILSRIGSAAPLLQRRGECFQNVWLARAKEGYFPAVIFADQVLRIDGALRVVRRAYAIENTRAREIANSVVYEEVALNQGRARVELVRRDRMDVFTTGSRPVLRILPVFEEMNHVPVQCIPTRRLRNFLFILARRARLAVSGAVVKPTVETQAEMGAVEDRRGNVVFGGRRGCSAPIQAITFKPSVIPLGENTDQQ